jgi:zinc transporter ZupT
MSPSLYALVFGIMSGTSLPLGAALGVYFSPVADDKVALMMGFGAGALLFAVTVELYGHALHEVSAGHSSRLEIFVIIGGALFGAAFYLSINQWLEEHLTQKEGKEGAASEGGDDGIESGGGGATTVMGELHKLRAAKQAEDELKADLGQPTGSKSGKDLWRKARSAKHAIRTMSIMSKKEMQKLRAREKAMRALHDPEEINRAKSVALSLFLGLLVDGVPEGILMGFLSAEGHLTPVLIVSLFIANFPEAFSSSSLLIQAWPFWKILAMWTFLALLVGCLSGASCYLLLWMFPKYGTKMTAADLPTTVLLGIALIEGITGGAMISCISSVMLPEAFERGDKTGMFWKKSGFFCTAGFLLSVAMKAVFG